MKTNDELVKLVDGLVDDINQAIYDDGIRPDFTEGAGTFFDQDSGAILDCTRVEVEGAEEGFQDDQYIIVKITDLETEPKFEVIGWLPGLEMAHHDIKTNFPKAIQIR